MSPHFRPSHEITGSNPPPEASYPKQWPCPLPAPLARAGMGGQLGHRAPIPRRCRQMTGWQWLHPLHPPSKNQDPLQAVALWTALGITFGLSSLFFSSNQDGTQDGNGTVAGPGLRCSYDNPSPLPTSPMAGGASCENTNYITPLPHW